MQYTVTATRDASSSLIRSAKTTTPLMNSMCIFQSSMSNYLVNSTQARSEVSFLRTLSLNATFRYSGTWMGPPHFSTSGTAWHCTGMEALMAWMFSMSVQDKDFTEGGRGKKNDDKRKEIEKKRPQMDSTPPKRELVSLNDWRMLAQRNSAWHFKNTLKSFRGLQFKDRKTSDRHVRKQGGGGKRRHCPVSVGNARRRSESHNRSPCLHKAQKSSVVGTNGAILWPFVLVCSNVSHLSLFIYFLFFLLSFRPKLWLSTSKTLCKQIGSSGGRLWRMTSWQNGM